MWSTPSANHRRAFAVRGYTLALRSDPFAFSFVGGFSLHCSLNLSQLSLHHKKLLEPAAVQGDRGPTRDDSPALRREPLVFNGPATTQTCTASRPDSEPPNLGGRKVGSAATLGTRDIANQTIRLAQHHRSTPFTPAPDEE